MTLTLASTNNRHSVNYWYKGKRHYELWHRMDVAQFKIKSISKATPKLIQIGFVQILAV